MKQPNKIAIVYNRFHEFIQKLSFLFLKIRGLQGGKNSNVASISCNWPNKLIIGNNCDIQDRVDFKIWDPYNESSYIELGNKVFIGHACEFVCNARIVIGNNCLIASKTTINNTGHEIKINIKFDSQPITTKEILIEDDVWIGTSCVILQGVSIGRGAIIAAGSVVNKSIPSNEVWGGVPARFIKKRT